MRGPGAPDDWMLPRIGLLQRLGRIQSAEMVEATVLYRTFVYLLLIIAALAFTGLAAAQEHVAFATDDGGTIYADMYGT